MRDTSVVPPRPTGIAFQLSRLGALATARFAERMAPLGLTPSHVGVLRVVGRNPGLNQRQVAERLGTTPSRVVRLVDELEEAGLVRRERSAVDRRNYGLEVPERAKPRVREVLAVVGAHDADLVRGLSKDEIAQLGALLGKLSASLGLAADAHPGSQPAE